jgi:hypothetical protein
MRRRSWTGIPALLALAGCSGTTGPTEVRTLEIAEFTVPCIGVGPQECMLVRTEPGAEFQLFYDQILGFTWEPGFRYRLLVSIHTRRNAPADGSAQLTRLIRVESRTPSPHAGLLTRLRQSEQLWNHTRPPSYMMVQERLCFCLQQAIGPVRMHVTVEQDAAGLIDERITSLQYVLDGTDVPAQFAPAFLTVQDLFTAIYEAVLDEAHRIDAEFETIAGYPVRVFIDRRQAIADDEVEYRVLSLTPF